MEASILIVSRNRCAELHNTLKMLQDYVNLECHEILVFLDGCSDDSEKLINLYPEVKWEISKENLGASKARNILYKKARGTIFFGFDDDSHPLQPDFIKITKKIFSENNKLGIIAFKEIKGIFKSDEEIPESFKKEKQDYLVKDFLGCGFAIKKKVYERTRGFPVWIDIYGEEVCVAMETLDLGYNILFTYKVLVNHRTDKQKLNIAGANYYRFQKQLKNTAFFYMVYYPFPLVLKKIVQLYLMNFMKYALKDRNYFKNFLYSFWQILTSMRKILFFRKQISRETLYKFNRLSNPEY
jgi:GT2 family glycosyltransferase